MVFWWDENVVKVVKKVYKFFGFKLNDLLFKFDIVIVELFDYGYWFSGNLGEYIEYEVDSDLCDSENVLFKDNIYVYFLWEVCLYVDDVWLDILLVKIGYEISFNCYFY